MSATKSPHAKFYGEVGRGEWHFISSWTGKLALFGDAYILKLEDTDGNIDWYDFTFSNKHTIQLPIYALPQNPRKLFWTPK